MPGLTPKARVVLQIIGAATLTSAVALYWYSRIVQSAAQSATRGEEVYASHDCTDCHLPAHTLRQKKDQGELGLLRVRRREQELRLFLESDARHRSFVLMAENDRVDLIAYLRSLIP